MTTETDKTVTLFSNAMLVNFGNTPLTGSIDEQAAEIIKYTTKLTPAAGMAVVKTALALNQKFIDTKSFQQWGTNNQHWIILCGGGRPDTVKCLMSLKKVKVLRFAGALMKKVKTNSPFCN